jgi:hypothetical protein
MVTAKFGVENLFGTKHDLWSVNVEEDYHEEVDHSKGTRPAVGTGRDAPLIRS